MDCPKLSSKAPGKKARSLCCTVGSQKKVRVVDAAATIVCLEGSVFISLHEGQELILMAAK